MAASLNKVFLMGNLTRDPELRYVPSGTAVANFTVAVNRAYSTQSGEKKEEVAYVRIVVWGRRAEVCGEYLSKGRPVFIEGRIRTRTWQGPDGQNRSALEVIASNVQFLGGGKFAAKGKEEALKPADEVDSIDIAEGTNNAEEGAGGQHPDTAGGEEEIPF